MSNKIIGFVSGFSLDLPAIKNRIIPIVEKVIKEGYEVKIYSPTTSRLPLNHMHIKYICLNKSSDNSKNFYLRSIHELITSFKIMSLAYKGRHDLLIVGVPSIFNLFFSKKINSKQYIDIRDLVWDYIDSKNLINRSIKFCFTKIARNRLKVFDLITCTNKSEYEHLKKFLNLDSHQIYLLRNGIGKKQFIDLSKTNQTKLRNDFKRTQISYIGNIGSAQKLETFLYAARQLSSIDFNIVGYGRQFNYISGLVRSLELKNVRLTNRLEWSGVLNIYKNSDILYAQIDSNFFRAVPSKLYEYLSSGKYIIYGGCGEAKDLLGEFDNNIVIPPADEKELIQAIHNIVEKRKYTKISITNRLRIKDNYVREDLVEKFFNNNFSF